MFILNLNSLAVLKHHLSDSFPLVRNHGELNEGGGDHPLERKLVPPSVHDFYVISSSFNIDDGHGMTS